jgi:hypothetical protein
MPTAAERALKVSVHDIASNEIAMLGQSASINIEKAVKERKQIDNELINLSDKTLNLEKL